jgi:hypothetical protein
MILIDIGNRLKDMDEVSIIEHLHITSEELVERFDDRIEELSDELEKTFWGCDEPDDS